MPPCIRSAVASKVSSTRRALRSYCFMKKPVNRKINYFFTYFTYRLPIALGSSGISILPSHGSSISKLCPFRIKRICITITIIGIKHTCGEGRKPNSVYAAIYLGRASPCGSLRPTHSLERAILRRLPTWPCTGWGLPCHPHYCGRGELLPRLFTLTLSGGMFSVALSVASRRPGVTRHPALRCSDFPHRRPHAAGRRCRSSLSASILFCDFFSASSFHFAPCSFFRIRLSRS